VSILKLLGLDPAADLPVSAETETVRKIAGALDRLEPDRARFLAAFAYILSRVARADLDISAVEVRAMERIVMDRGGLPEPQAALVVQIAKTQSNLFGATENYLVTREFYRISTLEDRRALIDCLFAVCASDGSVSAVEDAEIRQVADEIRVEHRDFIGIRSAYRDYLAVLQKGPAGPA
jgi:uncharacterized tellurite resistance protein B-like protein